MTKLSTARSAEADHEPHNRVMRLTSPCDHCEARPYSFCDSLEGQEFQRLAAIALGRAFTPRQTVVEEGQPADHLINIVSGTVKLVRSLSDGRVQIVGFLKRGDFLGIPPNGSYSVGAEAITPVEVCTFSRPAFERVLKEYPTLERRLFDLASNDIAAARDHLLLLGRKSARERVATFLNLMVAKAPCSHAGAPATTIDLPMTRVEIADYLGMTMETVSRTINGFRTEGLIAMPTPTELTLKHADKLRAIAEGDG